MSAPGAPPPPPSAPTTPPHPTCHQRPPRDLHRPGQTLLHHLQPDAGFIGGVQLRRQGGRDLPLVWALERKLQAGKGGARRPWWS